MKRLLVAARARVVALAAPVAASAHPLGNFTVNRYSELEVSGDRLYVVYVLDLAEIPTFQAREAGEHRRRTAYAQRIAANLAPDRRRPARTARRRCATRSRSRRARAGCARRGSRSCFAGPTLAGHAARSSYRDGNYAGRLGWKEIVVGPSARSVAADSSAPSQSVSDELRAYPKNLLQSPLDVRVGPRVVEPGSTAGAAPACSARSGSSRRAAVRAVADSGFASLIGRDDLGVWFVLASLAIAFFWGAAHALSPGPRQVDRRRLPGRLARHAAARAAASALTVTVTHTIGVFALGAGHARLSQFIVPDAALPVAEPRLGAARRRRRRSRVLRWRVATGAHGARATHHGHAHGHDHASRPPRPRPGARRCAGLLGDRHLGRDHPVPDRARRPARRDLAAPRRLRPRPDRRLQPRPGRHDERDRPPRGRRQGRLRPRRLRRRR